MSRFHARIAGPRWERARRAALDRAGWRCESCGLARPLDVHHVEALHHGGAPYDLDNLRALCRDCHTVSHGHKRSHKSMNKWRKFVEALRA